MLHITQLRKGLLVTFDEAFRGDAPDALFGIVYRVETTKLDREGDIRIAPLDGGRHLRVTPLALDLAEVLDTR